jgi:uncharacterized protein
MKLNAIDWVAIVLVIIGGLNWGLVGFFKFDLVAKIFGDMSGLSRVVYALVGLSAVYLVYTATKLMGAAKADV